MLLIVFLGYGIVEKQDAAQKGIVKKMIRDIQNKKPREEIFGYLKAVQSLEDRFYALAAHNMDLMDNSFSQDKRQQSYLEEMILKIDTLILDLTNLETNDYIKENHQLFLEEIKVMRDVIMEEKLSIENQDSKSHIKAKEYLKKYNTIAKTRKQVLKKVFDRYDIVYIDLGNRIKYKIK